MSFVLPNEIKNEASRDARPVQANFAAVSDALNNDVILVDGTVAMAAELTLAGSPSADLHAATKGYVDQIVPVGAVSMYAGATAPTGYLLCQGQLVNKSTYPDLWDLIEAAGNPFGAATSTQFRLPDLRSRFPVGLGTASWSNALGESGGSADAVLVSHGHDHSISASQGDHSHPVGGETINSNDAVGKFYTRRGTPGTNFDWADPGEGSRVRWDAYQYPPTSDASAGAITISGGITAAGESATNNNLPPYVTMNFIIKAS